MSHFLVYQRWYLKLKYVGSITPEGEGGLEEQNRKFERRLSIAKPQFRLAYMRPC